MQTVKFWAHHAFHKVWTFFYSCGKIQKPFVIQAAHSIAGVTSTMRLFKKIKYLTIPDVSAIMAIS